MQHERALGHAESARIRNLPDDVRKWLKQALDVAEGRIKSAYGDTPTPILLRRLTEARQQLQGMVR